MGAHPKVLRRHPLLVALLVVVALLAAAALTHRPLLRAAGRALVVSEAPGRSDAIVVVAGGTPTREGRAAELYRAGVAPLVVVSRQSLPGRVQTLIAMGVRPLDYQGEAVAVLQKYGVPREAIVTLDQPVEITETELREVLAAAKARGWRRLTLVTNASHSRRVR